MDWGEGPLWSTEEQALYWVDIVGKDDQTATGQQAPNVKLIQLMQMWGQLLFGRGEASLLPAAMGFRSGIWARNHSSKFLILKKKTRLLASTMEKWTGQDASGLEQ